MSASHEDRFPTTRWYLLDRAASEDLAARRAAVAELVSLYAKPIRRFVASRRGVRQDEIDDIVHDFLTVKWLEQDFLARAKPEKGRFRWFLSVSLGRYVSNWLREASKQRGKRDDVELEGLGFDDRSIDDFDLQWARMVLEQAIDLFRFECKINNRADVWGVFEARVIGPCLEQKPPVEYDVLVARFALRSPAQASNVLMTAKRGFLRALREVVSSYNGQAVSIDEEVAELLSILRRS